MCLHVLSLLQCMFENGTYRNSHVIQTVIDPLIGFVDDDSDGLYTKACFALTCSKM